MVVTSMGTTTVNHHREQLICTVWVSRNLKMKVIYKINKDFMNNEMKVNYNGIRTSSEKRGTKFYTMKKTLYGTSDDNTH